MAVGNHAYAHRCLLNIIIDGEVADFRVGGWKNRYWPWRSAGSNAPAREAVHQFREKHIADHGIASSPFAPHSGSIICKILPGELKILAQRFKILKTLINLYIPLCTMCSFHVTIWFLLLSHAQ